MAVWPTPLSTAARPLVLGEWVWGLFGFWALCVLYGEGGCSLGIVELHLLVSGVLMSLASGFGAFCLQVFFLSA